MSETSSTHEDKRWRLSDLGRLGLSPLACTAVAYTVHRQSLEGADLASTTSEADVHEAAALVSDEDLVIGDTRNLVQLLVSTFAAEPEKVLGREGDEING